MFRRTIPIAILVLSPILTFAQSDVNKMLKDINSKVDEIVIKSEGKEFTFSGDEAEKLFTSMKENKKVKQFSFVTEDGKEFSSDSMHKKIIIKSLDDDIDSDEKDIIVFIDEDDDMIDGDIQKIEKKIIVTDDGVKKVVKVTINEDGKENIEVYEGKAGDEYLEKMKSDENCKIKINDSGCCVKSIRK